MILVRNKASAKIGFIIGFCPSDSGTKAIVCVSKDAVEWGIGEFEIISAPAKLDRKFRRVLKQESKLNSKETVPLDAH